MAVKFSAFTTRTGTLDASTRIVGYDDPAGTKTNVEFTLATLVANSGIYGADGTIGASRVATITDFPKFSGTQGNPIGLELENTQTGSGALTTLGAQLKLTSNSATATIGYFNGGGGGSNAPALVLDSPARMWYKAAVDAGHAFQLAHGSFNFLNDASQNYPIFESIVAGGGGNYSEFRLAKSGNNYNYINSPYGVSTKRFAWGKYHSSTDTEYMRITDSAQLGINSGGLTISETLHVNGNARIDGQAYTALYANATNLVVDWNDGNVQAVTISGSAPTFAPTNPKAGATYILTLTQGATPVAVDFNSLVKWSGGAPTLSSTTGQIDVITLICYNDSGSGLYYGAASLNLA